MGPCARLAIACGLAAGLSAGTPPAAGEARPIEIKACRQVVVQVDDPAARATGETVAKWVCDRATQLAPRFGLNRGQLVWVRIAADTRAFHRLTGQSFHTVAVYQSRGIRDMIITQPADLLGDRARVEQVLTHELIHLMVRRALGGRCPTWLNEGLAQWFAGQRTGGAPPASEQELEALERRWHDPATSVTQRRQDYRASVALVARWVEQVGEEAMLAAVLRLRTSVRVLDLDIDGRSVRMWLFPADGAADPGLTELPLDEMIERARTGPPPKP